MIGCTPPAAEPFGALEPIDEALLGLAQELMACSCGCLSSGVGRCRARVDHESARWALVHAGLWADEVTLGKFRASIRVFWNKEDAA